MLARECEHGWRLTTAGAVALVRRLEHRLNTGTLVPASTPEVW